MPRHALKTPFRNVTVRELALDALRISHRGLKRRGIEDVVGRDETQYLTPLFQIAEASHPGRGPAVRLQPPLGRKRRSGLPRIRVLRRLHHPAAGLAHRHPYAARRNRLGKAGRSCMMPGHPFAEPA
ncbi:MAG: hypothetical protein U1E38_06510 [Rhodospirillales bacterium]